MQRLARLYVNLSLGALAFSGLPHGAVAQNAMVQPLPPPEAEDLSEALRRLAQSPRDLDALLEAGEASVALGDSDAAMGFFVRAQDFSPGNARMKAGLGRVFLAEGRAIEALRFFAEAETAGYPLPEMAADRGLAFDLVGDNLRAQELYRLALARNDDPATSRRLALSLAISGQRAEFERILLPQLQAEDRAGFRTRAFGLAILGEEREAISIAEALMPTDLALRMTPYLRYMSRLTKAQQAAAANLGTFPRASEIGRDMPGIAGYADQGGAITRRADASLTPSGPVMGSTRPPQVAAVAPAADPRPTTRPARQMAERSGRGAPSRAELAARSRQSAEQTVQAQPTPAPSPPPGVPQASGPAPVQAAPASPAGVSAQEFPPAQTASPLPKPAPTEAPVPTQLAIALPPVSTRASAATNATNATNAPIQGPVADPNALIESFDPGPAAIATSLPAATQPAASRNPGPLPTGRLEDVFAEFEAIPSATPAASVGAVDVTAIQAPRERAAPPPPPPAPERVAPPVVEHPSRHWVQVATGRDRNALKFDWRRISRNAQTLLDGRGPFVTPWVEANRLLAGPYPSAAEARAVVAKLKELEIDSFTFQSPRGQEIEKLD